MDTSVLRLNVIDKIKNSIGDELLMDIARLIKVDDSYKKMSFTEEQKLSIQNSIKEYEQGIYLTDEEAEADIQKWLED